MTKASTRATAPKNSAGTSAPMSQLLCSARASGISWTIGAWRGFAGPKGLPQEVTDKLVPAFAKVYESNDYKNFMGQRGVGVIYMPPEEFAKFAEARDQSLGEVMKGIGLAK